MNTKICLVCKTPIPANAPGGLCPACILRDADEPAPAGRAAPALAEIAAAFPQIEIEALIGQGGMGFVYKARQPALDRTVALKILAPELSRDPAFAERFAREARVLGKLNHPNIVTVFEHGTAGAFFYLLMEYVDGVNLRQAMRAGRFTPAQALAVVPGICDALQAAHAQGVWHRDIKPENILLDARGGVKIADFGIARIVGDPGRDFTLTATGAALGSAAYMAPEQHESPHDVDHRADIYSLGVVIYEMLTGELPLGRFPAPSQRAAVDARIDEIVFRTLEKERELRQQSAAEVKTDVAGATNSPAAALPSPAPRFSRTAIVGAAWAAFFGMFVVQVVMLRTMSPAELGLSPFWRLFSIFDQKLLTLTAPIATTILGWLAVTQIRRSAGKLHGLWLALFDGLLFPLFALDGIILVAASAAVLKIHGIEQSEINGIHAVVTWTIAGWLLLIGGVVLLDYLIIRRVWRAVNSHIAGVPPAAPSSNGAPPAPLTLWSLGLLAGGCVMTGAAIAFTGGSAQGVMLTFALVAVALGWIASWFTLSSMRHGRISTSWRSGLRFAAWAPLIAAVFTAVAVPVIFFLRSASAMRDAEQAQRTPEQAMRNAVEEKRQSREPMPERLRKSAPVAEEKPPAVSAEQVVRQMNALANESNGADFKKHLTVFNRRSSELLADHMKLFVGKLHSVKVIAAKPARPDSLAGPHPAETTVFAIIEEVGGAMQYQEFGFTAEEGGWRFHENLPARYRAACRIEFRPEKGDATAILRTWLGEEVRLSAVAGADGQFDISAEDLWPGNAKDAANDLAEKLQSSLKKVGQDGAFKIIRRAERPAKPWRAEEAPTLEKQNP